MSGSSISRLDIMYGVLVVFFIFI